MATLPVTPKKEGKENYFPQQRLLAKETFAVFIYAIQYLVCCFVEGIYGHVH